MKSKVFSLFVVMLISISAWSQLTLKIDSITVDLSQSGTNINIPVIATVGYSMVTAMQFKLDYDTTVLTPVYQNPVNTGVVNFLSASLANGGSWLAGANGGSISPNWFDPTFMGINIANGDTIFELQFTYNGGEGIVSFDSTSCLISDENFSPLSIAFNSGGVFYGANPPSVNTGNADSITATSASLMGTVNPNNELTNIWFKFGTDTIYTDSIVPMPGLANGVNLVSVYASVSNLIAGTEYHYRLFAENTAGLSYGQDVSFMTVPAQMPYAETSNASNISSTSASLNGEVSANNASTTAYFEYGTDTTYGMTDTVAQNPFFGQDTLSAFSTISGLIPNTEYHFRLSAMNSEGTSNGSDMTFSTEAVLAYVENQIAESITLNSATLKGRVSANNAQCSIYFVYGENGVFTDSINATPSQSNGMDTIDVEVQLSSLTGNSNYSYVLKAENIAGLAVSQTLSFSTNITSVPDVTTLQATNISASNAVLNAEINPNNAATTIAFEYGLDNTFGQTISGDPSSLIGTSSSNVMAELTGLTPNTTYHYRVVATNSEGTSNGDDITFTTANDKTMSIKVESVDAPQNIGDTVRIPVIIELGYDSVTAIQLRFTYDTTVLTPIEMTSTRIGITNENSVTTAAGDWFCGSLDNTLSPNWLDNTFEGVNLQSGVKLFDLIFTYLGGNSPLSFDVSQCFVYDEDNVELNVSYLSGSVGNPAPALITLEATDIDISSATLNGSVNSFGSDATVWFEYGLDNTYGDFIVASPSIINDTVDVLASVFISGLIENETYHYRIAAQSVNGISYGEDMYFTTQPNSIEIMDTDLPSIFSANAKVFIKFKSDISDIHHVKIFDINGRLILSDALYYGNTFSFNLDYYTGIVIVSVLYENELISKKLLVK